MWWHGSEPLSFLQPNDIRLSGPATFHSYTCQLADMWVPFAVRKNDAMNIHVQAFT